LPGDGLSVVLLLTLLWSALTAVTAMDRRMAAEALWWQLLFVGLVFLGRRVGPKVLPGVLAGAAGVAVLGLAQLAGLTPAAGGYLTEGGGVRISSSLNHPNNLCGFIALVLPVVLSTLVVRTRHRRVPMGMVAVPVALLAIALLVCAAGTYSRAGQAAVAAGLLAWLAALPAGGLRGWWRANPQRAALLVLAGLVGFLALGAAVVASGAGERIRLFLELLPTWRKYQRVDTWLTALRMVRMHPLFGVGPGCFFLAYPLTKTAASYPDLFGHAHSSYLQVAAEGGVPALVGLLAALALALRQALRGARAAADEAARLRSVGLFAGLVGFMAAGLADHNVGVPAIGMAFWFLLGIAAGGSAEDAEAEEVGAGRSRGARYGAALAACLLWMMLVPMVLWNRAHSAYQAFLADVAADRRGTCRNWGGSGGERSPRRATCC
ncbi:MAG: O-antigen ligase family protein, partial [Armatimonadetes bacterium]|nr:O-antigen ligase family protein [Armatimonadota bacterium]